MKKYRLGIVGLGHAARWHLGAIKILSNLFEIVGIFDIDPQQYRDLSDIEIFLSLDSLLEKDLDCVVLTSPSWTKYPIAEAILKSGKNLFSEKPFVTNLEEFNTLIDIAHKKKLLLHGALHARFGSETISFSKEIEKLDRCTRHHAYGGLVEVFIKRFDPYVRNDKIVSAPEKSSGMDSWPNIFSELDLYTQHWQIEKVVALNISFGPEYPEVATTAEGTFPGGKFKVQTDWTRNINQKITRLYFENAIVELDHTSQMKKIISPNETIISSTKYCHIGERMEVEYFRMYEDLYEVLSGTIPDNRNLTKKLIGTSEKLLQLLSL